MSLLRDDLNGYKPASNLLFNQVVQELRAKGKRIYHLAFGQSPFPVIASATEALRQHVGANEYLPSNGLQDLRKAISAFHKRYDGLESNVDNIIVGPGSKELIFLLMTVFGGEVLVLSPTWTTYKPQAMLSGRPCTMIESNLGLNWKLTPDLLQTTLGKLSCSVRKLLIFCNPDNPTGVSYTDRELEALSDVLRRHRVIVLSDEIYGRLRYDGKHTSLVKFYPEGTILSSGLSKWASAGGWRLGYHLFPDELGPLRDAVVSAASHSYSCAPAPMQHAAIQMFGDTVSCDDYIKHTSRILSAAANFCHTELREVGVKSVLPTAGYYIFPDFEILRESLNSRGITTCEQMCSAMLTESSVAVMAGGPSYLRPLEELTVRMCFVNFDGSLALSESRALGLSTPLPVDFIKTRCTPLHEAIQALKHWVKQELDRNSDVGKSYSKDVQ